MKLVGLMPVRNEDWVLGLSARVALQWCDELVLFEHACTDKTQDIGWALSDEFPKRIHRLCSSVTDWYEMAQRQSMLERARLIGATHIAMIDADEVLTANLLGRTADVSPIRTQIANLAPGQMLELPGYNLRGSLDRYHSNGIWGNRWFSVAFKDTPEAHWAGDKFHSRNPAGVKWQNWRPIQQGEGGVMHLWGASERRLRAKHALYKVTERLRWPAKPAVEIDRMYNLWRSMEDALVSYPKQWGETWEYARTPQAWWKPHWPITAHDTLRLDCELWQEAEVRRLVQEHGKEKFQGLDLFGVA